MPARAAIVTGASRGIGERLAGMLAAAGFGVSLVSQNGDGRLAEVGTRMAGTSADVLVLPADLRDAAGIRGVVRAHAERFGRLDVLVHSAGVLAVGPLSELDESTVDDVLSVNIRAAVLLLRECIAMLTAAAGEGGTPLVLLLGSVAGLRGSANLGVYSASKFAVVGFAEAMAAELAPQGVRVCALCPDRVATTEASFGDPSLIALDDVERVVGALLALSPAAGVPVLPLRLARAG